MASNAENFSIWWRHHVERNTRRDCTVGSTYWHMRDLDIIPKNAIFNFVWLIWYIEIFSIMLSEGFHGTLLVINHRLGAVRQQAITWANAFPDLCRLLESLGHNGLTVWQNYTSRRSTTPHIWSYTKIFGTCCSKPTSHCNHIYNTRWFKSEIL